MFSRLFFYFFISINSLSFAQNNKVIEIDSIINIGDSLRREGKFDHALKFYKTSVNKSKNIDYDYGIAKSYLNIAGNYLVQQDSKSALKYIFLGEKYAEKLSEEYPDLMYNVYAYKGMLLHLSKSYEEAIKRYQKAIDFAKKITDKKKSEDKIFAITTSLNSIYTFLGKHDLAISFANVGFNTDNISFKLISSNRLAVGYLNKNRLDSAKKYINYVDENLNQLDEFNQVVISQENKFTKGLYYIKMNEYRKAITELRSIDKTYFYTYDLELNDLLGTAYSKLNKSDSAIYYFKLNSIAKKNKQVKNIDDTIATSIIYNDEKEKFNKEHSLKTKFYAGFLILSIIIILILCYLYFLKQKSLKEEAKLLVSKKEKLEIEKELSVLRQDQLKFKISENNAELEQNKDFLNELKSQLSKDKNFNVETYISTKFGDENSHIKLSDIVKEVYPNFYNSLNELSNNKLNDLDFKYLIYMYLHMNNSQIASILDVSSNSVNVYKFRLKKKLNLPKEIILEDYIRELK